jgi:hypothetical protein
MDEEQQDRQQFLALLESRLAQGQRDYGNASFYKSYAKLRDELLCEYLDVAGWAYISWRKAKRQLATVEERLAQLPNDKQNEEGVD